MIPIRINDLEKTDRIFLGWSSWNNYLNDVKKQLNHSGFRHVDIRKLKKNWRTLLLLPFIALKMIFYLFHYDAFFLFNGKSFFLPIPLILYSKLPFLFFKDLWVLKLLNKKIYLVFQGSDIRNYGNSSRYKYIRNVNSTIPPTYSVVMGKSLRMANGIVVSTFDLFQDLPRYCLERSVWIPKLANYDMYIHDCFRSLEGGFKSNKIVHATTNRELKGTNLLEEVFKKINNFKFTVLERNDRSGIFQNAQDCFCCIDQLLLGGYGTFCMEMMELGVPVLGYISQTTRNMFAEKYGIDIPILQIGADNLQTTIQKQLKFLSNFENYCLQIELQKEFLEKFHKV